MTDDLDRLGPKSIDEMSLTELRAWLRERVDDGHDCPVCTQFAKVYRRKITSAVGRILIAMYRCPEEERDADGYIHVPTLRGRMSIDAGGGGDSTKAAYWGLIEPMPDARRDDGSTRVGYWRLTALGIAFVRGTARVPKYARIYDGRCLSLDDSETVSIRDVLGERFNYDDLMAGV